jgi:hypothetical protein
MAREASQNLKRVMWCPMAGARPTSDNRMAAMLSSRAQSTTSMITVIRRENPKKSKV